MARPYLLLSAFVAVIPFAISVSGQIDEICSEAGVIPSLDAPRLMAPYVFGRVTVKGLDPGAKMPKVTITLYDVQQTEKRSTIDKSGKYCFRRTGSAGGTLVIEVNGVEVARKTIPSFGAAQQREDFEVYPPDAQKQAAPSTVSAKYSYPQNPNTLDLYRKAAEAERNKDIKAATETLKEIVGVDQKDFIAWAKLGSLYFEQGNYKDAEASYRSSLALRPDYVPAWINAGLLRAAQKQFEAAIEVFKHTATLEPTSARVFQLLGQTYLQAKKGTLAVDALNEAIRLDPVGMAECHLELARLYDLAGAKDRAVTEYKQFLEKVPEHNDRKKLEKYIKENSK